MKFYVTYADSPYGSEPLKIYVQGRLAEQLMAEKIDYIAVDAIANILINTYAEIEFYDCFILTAIWDNNMKRIY